MEGRTMNPETQALIAASQELERIALQNTREHLPIPVAKIVWHAQDYVGKLLVQQLGRES